MFGINSPLDLLDLDLDSDLVILEYFQLIHRKDPREKKNCYYLINNGYTLAYNYQYKKGIEAKLKS
jgi:hypothetical protein